MAAHPVPVTLLPGAERRGPTGVGIALLALASLIGVAGGIEVGVVIGARVKYAQDAARSHFRTADSVTVATLDANAGAAVPGSSRLVLMGPKTVLDDRATAGLPPGGEVELRLSDLPASTTAVVLNLSLVNATGPGAVTVASAAGSATVLRIPKAKSMTSTTAVVPVGPDGAVRVGTEGGGQLLVNLVGAFELADSATAGRVIPVAPTRVLRLVPKTDGKNAVINVAGIEALRAAGSVSAVLLKVAGDVGPNGGFVAVNGGGDAATQVTYWSATAGADRTRGGFMVVPIANGTINLHYEAGNVLTADVVGYVTDGTAASSTEGLVVPVGGGSQRTVRIAAGDHADVSIMPSTGAEGVPPDRVTAAIVAIGATGDAVGAITVHAPDAPPGDPLMTAPQAATRVGATVVRTPGATVRVESAGGASVSVVVQALILGR